jgi:hypothetical protein
MLALAMISAAAVSAAPQPQAQLATRGSPHLKIMSYYGFNPPLMAGWVNMGLESSLPSKLAAWAKYKIPSFCARPTRWP